MHPWASGYWFFATNAVFLRGHQGWGVWNQGIKKVLTSKQRGGGCEAGSWDPVDPWCPAGGRVYATAINALTLEVYYRFARWKPPAKTPGYLGARTRSLTSAKAKSMGIPRRGVWVLEVRSGSPAAKAGIRVDDVLTHLNGNKLLTNSSLKAQLDRAPAGTRIELRLIRERTARDVNVVLATHPE